jgi:hypothetical protein
MSALHHQRHVPLAGEAPVDISSSRSFPAKTREKYFFNVHLRDLD